MPIPNLTPETAIVIPSLPFTLSTSAFEGGVAKTLWYKYTAVIGDEAISVFGFGSPAPYAPYSGIAPSGLDGLPDYDHNISGGRNVPAQMDVTPGKDYFISFDSFGVGAVMVANLDINVISHSPVAYPIGSLVIPDDTFGFPAVILSPSTGEVLKFISPFPAGEIGDALQSNGNILTEDYENNCLRLYDGYFHLLATLTYATLGMANGVVRSIFAVQSKNTFYVALEDDESQANSIIRKVSVTGVLDPMIWAVPSDTGIAELAVNNDETILYASVGRFNPTFNFVIARLDLVNNVELSDFVPVSPGSGNARGVLILGNDNIIISYTNPTTHLTTINEYTPANVLLHSYTFPNLNFPRIKPIASDPNLIWIWFLPQVNSIVSLFIKLRLSDGIHVEEFSQVQFNQGVYAGTPTPTPLNRFGHSNSCPLFLAYVGGAPEPPPNLGGVYKTVFGKKNDTLYTSHAPVATIDVKIPDPSVTHFLEGDE